MRTLILSCNTGEGHNSCAKAIQTEYAAHGESCEIVDALQFISKRASRFICDWHTRRSCIGQATAAWKTEPPSFGRALLSIAI